MGRDNDGYFRTGDIGLTTATHAITSDRLDLHGDAGEPNWLIERGGLGTVTLDLGPVRSGGAVFAGIARSDDVEAYLDIVSYDRVHDFDESFDDITYQRHDGSEIPSPPGEQTFWVAHVTTADADVLTWEPRSGDWTVVIMNTDASSGVEVNVRAGIKVDWLLPVAIGLTVLGFLLLAGGTVVAVFAARGSRPRGEPLADGTAAALPRPANLAPSLAAPGDHHHLCRKLTCPRHSTLHQASRRQQTPGADVSSSASTGPARRASGWRGRATKPFAETPTLHVVHAWMPPYPLGPTELFADLSPLEDAARVLLDQEVDERHRPAARSEHRRSDAADGRRRDSTPRCVGGGGSARHRRWRSTSVARLHHRIRHPTLRRARPVPRGRCPR